MKLFRVNTDGKFIRYAERDFKEGNQEEVLEFWFENNPAYILEDENVLIIGRQVPTNLGSIISSDFVIGKDMSLKKKVSSGALPRIDKAEFVNSLD